MGPAQNTGTAIWKVIVAQEQICIEDWDTVQKNEFLGLASQTQQAEKMDY